MELHVAKKQFDALNDELKRRREQLLGGKKKEAKVDASKAEKFKTMVRSSDYCRMNTKLH